MSNESKPIEVVAVVTVNYAEALVLNRPIRFVYERIGEDYVGSDGPFRDLLYFERGGGRFCAFAGRELHLPMADGSTQKLKNHWWSGRLPDHTGVVVGDVESLKKCYVFSGCSCIAPADLASLRSTYKGCVYPYWDYEKIIKFDDMRKDLVKRWLHEEHRRKALIREVKRLSSVGATGAPT